MKEEEEEEEETENGRTFACGGGPEWPLVSLHHRRQVTNPPGRLPGGGQSRVARRATC